MQALDISKVSFQFCDLVLELTLARPIFLGKRKQLEALIKTHGFDRTMEAIAYTWFNRLVAIRFMELHGYLDHGYRILSHSDGKSTPEILEHAEHVELPGLKRETIIDLKLAGNKEAELYRLLIVAQCNALHRAMPFLFEWIGDETELLLPDNLLHSDSLIRKLVSEIEENDWREVEIIGWLYQFYISEKKDEVIGKVVASEDIPAATQLFTPNWIVKYLVQNTLGRQWLATYPQSALRQQMEYYIEPAEQTPEVQEQLKTITPISLNPEELTLLDPACGSGHILVEAYDLFKLIYLERGYRAKEIPALILQKNLFGLEIDDRAAQLASLALMMTARADDPRIFGGDTQPNILAFADSQGMNAADITNALNTPINKDDEPHEYLFEEIEDDGEGLFNEKALVEKGHVSQNDITCLLELFGNARTFGSLIQVPPKLVAKLTKIEKRLDDVLKHGDLTHFPAHVIKPLLQQGRLLARQYDAVVANPPYMGSKYMPTVLKAFAKQSAPESKSDVFAMFIVRALSFSNAHGRTGFVAPYVWMTLTTYESFRRCLLSTVCIGSLVQLEYNAFEPACVPVCAFILSKPAITEYVGVFIRLSAFKGHQYQAARTIEAITTPDCPWKYFASSRDFNNIPGQPIAYWSSQAVRSLFTNSPSLGETGQACAGLQTGSNELFLRQWFEVSHSKIGFGVPDSEYAIASKKKWFPHKKGGLFRRWYGNCDYVVNWENDGKAIRDHPSAALRNPGFMFREGVTWSHTSSSSFSARYSEQGFTFNVEGPTFFSSRPKLALGYLCSSVALHLMQIMNPTLHFLVGSVSVLPFISLVEPVASAIEAIVQEAIALAQTDWNYCETSWDFQSLSIVQKGALKVETAQAAVDGEYLARFHRMKEMEEENNRLFIDAYGLQDELSAEVPEEQITLYRPNREEDAKRLISYAIGCIMGRYSLDRQGLIYAQAGNQGFDPDEYKIFRSDDSGIIPLLEADWGLRNDTAGRITEFIGVVWPKQHLEDNLKFIAEGLGQNNGEQPRDTIRRYLAKAFYKHHVSMYKKRPIYWLFSSGKQRAFQCLVYLHRYHEGTLARMRTEYVIPFQGQIAARIEQLEGDKNKATSTSQRKKLQKEQDDLKKQHLELCAFEEKLKHAADQKISLDLDDGVKVNYAKFGDLLAESTAITGGKDDE